MQLSCKSLSGSKTQNIEQEKSLQLTIRPQAPVTAHTRPSPAKLTMGTEKQLRLGTCVLADLHCQLGGTWDDWEHTRHAYAVSRDLTMEERNTPPPQWGSPILWGGVLD